MSESPYSLVIIRISVYLTTNISVYFDYDFKINIFESKWKSLDSPKHLSIE